jgi:hypothetical protein
MGGAVPILAAAVTEIATAAVTAPEATEEALSVEAAKEKVAASKAEASAAAAAAGAAPTPAAAVAAAATVASPEMSAAEAAAASAVVASTAEAVVALVFAEAVALAVSWPAGPATFSEEVVGVNCQSGTSPAAASGTRSCSKVSAMERPQNQRVRDVCACVEVR